MSEPTPLTDRAEITDLLTRMNRWLDDHRFSWRDDRRYAGVDRFYTSDVVLRSPRGTAHGLAELVDYLRRVGDDADHTQHVTSDVLIDLDGDKAEVTAYGVVYAHRPDDGLVLTAGLRAAYTTVRTPGGWRLADIEMTPLWRRAA
ncbi:nuclear transport factor 2 family protein [Actinomadura kijaniata]|uniref:nuclear transport factor 2 family protein n=1 Tax=Actinomadura kijaniata TaxID=46161 RepID=UPI003F1A686A